VSRHEFIGDCPERRGLFVCGFAPLFDGVLARSEEGAARRGFFPGGLQRNTAFGCRAQAGLRLFSARGEDEHPAAPSVFVDTEIEIAAVRVLSESERLDRSRGQFVDCSRHSRLGSGPSSGPSLYVSSSETSRDKWEQQCSLNIAFSGLFRSSWDERNDARTLVRRTPSPPDHPV
jgi:hypothetical protein